MKRVVLTTGGTGGHIFPALAVAEEIKRRHPDAMILFMGGQFGPEGDIAANAGLDFVGLPVRGVLGRGGKGVKAAFSMLIGIRKALGVMRKFNPELVVGFGGYAAFAGVLAGRLSGRATALHEQNSFPGMANRVLGKLVRRVFLSMPDVAGAFPAKKTVLVGNPVRAGIAALYEQRIAGTAGMADEPGAAGTADGDSAANAATGRAVNTASCAGEGAQNQRPFRLLVMGGSLGARALNQGMLAAFAPLLGAGIEVWHQTGQAEYEEIRAKYRESGATHVRVEAFITDMPKAYAWADLALCRAGGSSIAELTAAGVPAILVPFPFAAQDHQRYNARFLEKEGGAVVLEQDIFFGPKGSPAALSDAVLELAQNKAHLAHMAERSLAAAKPHAAKELVDGLEELLQK